MKLSFSTYIFPLLPPFFLICQIVAIVIDLIEEAPAKEVSNLLETLAEKLAKAKVKIFMTFAKNSEVFFFMYGSISIGASKS